MSDNATKRVRPGMQVRNGFGLPVIRKIPAASVPYGFDISRDGRTVWAAYSTDGERLIAVGATAGDVRRKYAALSQRGALPMARGEER